MISTPEHTAPKSQAGKASGNSQQQMSQQNSEVAVNMDYDAEKDLQFQNFSNSDTGIGTKDQQYKSSAFVPEAQEVESDGPKKPWWTLDYYQKYFDVDSNQVLKRILVSIVPRESLMDVISAEPDAYGPFWIATTVIFLIFMTDSVGVYLLQENENGVFQYKFDKLASSASIIYSFITIIPLLLWLLLRYLKYPVKFLELVDMYGYSLSIWIPLQIIAVAPSIGFHWFLTLIGIGVSSAFFARNCYPLFNQLEQQTESQSMNWGESSKSLSAGALTTILTVATQIGLGLTFQFYFFQHSLPE